MVELLSLLTAFCYGSSAVLTRRGMRSSNPLTGVVVGALVQVVLLTFVVLAIPPKNFSWAAFFYFVGSGLLASTFGRFLNYKSIEKLGVSLSATIIGSSPLFSTLFAVLFIGEDVAFTTLIGTALIVTGIAITRSGGRMGSNILDATVLLPIAAAAFYGISSVVRKVGLDILPESAFGALIGAGASLASFGAYFAVTGRLELVEINQESAKYFLASGLVVTIGWLSMFTALTTGNVSVVSALIGTNPLFSVILSLALLRDSENFNLRVALGCISIVVGTAAITLL